ncbi:GntP family permease [Fusobacterium sp. PH5-44]|uniref:GntP family permease n=1 Tax=unclassified Fusobacterium TaxID=2648384 RepID=UPI003D22F060
MIGILLGLLLLVFLCYKGYSIIWVAPVSAMVVAIFGFGLNGSVLLEAYTEKYMSSLATFTKSWFPLFFLGAVFGKMMDLTGSASAVARLLVKHIGVKRALLAVVVSCAVLTYGGVSLFVVVFAIYPLAISLYREANLPRRLIPGAIALGAFTFTMTAFPGSPQLNNIIAGKYFNTTPYAAPIMGIVAGLIMFFGGYLYLHWKQEKLVKAGEVFTEPSSNIDSSEKDENLPNEYIALLPLIIVVVALYILSKIINLPITPASILSLLLGNLAVALLNINKAKIFIKALNEGGNGSVIAILNTAAAVGFGGVVRAVPGFQILTDKLLSMKASPLISEALSITLLAGATGSSSGGMGIALEALGSQYVELASQLGINIEAFHRVATVASGGLDSLPHCGAVLTLLAVTGMTHKDSYNDIGMVTCVIPLVSLAACIILGMFGIV